MLTLDDAVKVTKRLVNDQMNDEEIIRQELEQKCYLPSYGPKKVLYGLVDEITPETITEQIRNDNLKRWTDDMRISVTIALEEMEGMDE